MIRTLLFFLVLSCTSFVYAQHSLPYTADWGTASGQADWTEYQLEATGFFDWSFGGTGKLTHDYPVGNDNAEMVSDWMVSPAINFHSTSKLNFSATTFTFIALTEPDYFGIWFSAGSKDPADGDYIEIVDLTNFSPGGNIWTDSLGVEIPHTASEGYLAIVYEATNNWFTTGIENLEIIPDTPSSSHTDFFEGEEISIYPTISSQDFIVEVSNEGITNEYDLLIFNSLGQRVASQEIHAGKQSIYTNGWLPGGYFYQISKHNRLVKTGKLVLKF